MTVSAVGFFLKPDAKIQSGIQIDSFLYSWMKLFLSFLDSLFCLPSELKEEVGWAAVGRSAARPGWRARRDNGLFHSRRRRNATQGGGWQKDTNRALAVGINGGTRARRLIWCRQRRSESASNTRVSRTSSYPKPIPTNNRFRSPPQHCHGVSSREIKRER